MEGQLTYQDFDLLIEPGPPGGYLARVVRSPAGECAPVQFTLPFSALELENLVLKVGLGRRRARGPGRPESAPLKDFGGKLYDAVFQDELRDVFQRSLSLTQTQQVGMRLRLRLADTPELAGLPWEFLYDLRHQRFLAQSRRTPLVRYLDLPDPPHPLSVDGPLRLLVVISSPSDYTELDAEHEWSLLTGALARQQAEGRVFVERLAANMSALRQRLRRDEFHVFHFIGHGRYRADWGSGVLVMEDRTGRSQEVTGEELGGLLSEYDQTRLAVLNACEGARGDASDPFAGVAQSLIQQGLPAVVAMQFEITDDAAISFAREFYGAIADGYPLEAALAEARGAIRDEGNLTEWGTPVLYSRAPDGRLFDPASRAKADADPDARVTQARAELAAEERAIQLDADYERALERVNAGDWPEALAILERVAHVNPAYRATPSLLARARRQLVDTGLTQDPIPEAATRDHAPISETGEVPELAHALTGHTGSIYGVAFSPDGRLLASCGSDETVRLWDPATGEHRRTLAGGHAASVYGVAFSPDGRLLASCGGKTVRLWDPLAGEHQRTLTGHTYVVFGVAFSPDGQLLASCSNDNTLRLWDPVTGEHRRTLAGPKAGIIDRIGGLSHLIYLRAVAFSPDGRLLASASTDETVRMWDPATGESRRTLAGHKGYVHCVAFSPDGRLLASGGDHRTVQLWDPATGENRRTLAGHRGAVRGVAFSPDGRLLASCGDTTVRLWDVATGQHWHSLIGHKSGRSGEAKGVSFSPDGRMLASCGADGTVLLWDLTSTSGR